MAEDAPTREISEDTASSEELPAKLRVHSLARMLGTTSKRIVDALAQLDGRARSPHSTVARDEAERVRDVLNSESAASAVEVPAPAATEATEPAAEPVAVESVAVETPDGTVTAEAQVTAEQSAASPPLENENWM